MAYFREIPYTTLSQLNLDWLIKGLQELETDINNFVALNTIKYANPFDWNITTQYAMNTLVFNTADYTAYLSVKPVPSGVKIDNTEYWTPVFTLKDVLTAYRDAITPVFEQAGSPATTTIEKGQLFWIESGVYSATAKINQGDTVAIGTNCAATNISAELLKLTGLITTEQTARENADTAERTARENADTALQNAITAEQTARENADAALQNEISNMLSKEFFDISEYYEKFKDIGAAVTKAISEDKIKIRIPKGTYYSKTTARISKSGANIIGDGMQNTVIKYPDQYTDHTCFVADTRDNDTSIYGISISNLQIDGNRDNAAAGNDNSTAINTICLKSGGNERVISNSEFYNLLIKNFTNSGIHIHGDWTPAEGDTSFNGNRNVYVHDCIIQNLGINNVRGSGIVFSHVVNGVIERCTIDTTGQENMTNDNGCYNISVRDCRFRGANGGAGTLSADTCKGFLYTGCFFDGAGARGDLDPGQHYGVVINDGTGFSWGSIIGCYFRNYQNSAGICIKPNTYAPGHSANVDIVACQFYGGFSAFVKSLLNAGDTGQVTVSDCSDQYGGFIPVKMHANSNTVADARLCSNIDFNSGTGNLSVSKYKTTQSGLVITNPINGFQAGLYLFVFTANVNGQTGTVKLSAGSTNTTRNITSSDKECNVTIVAWVTDNSKISVELSGASCEYPRLLCKYLANYKT